MSISAIIVDDEPHARQAMSRLLQPHADIDVLCECDNGLTAVKAVNERHPNVVFLDIHMPKLDGFDVLDLLGDEAPLIVFVTAHDTYALQAFENNAVDYLLKPVSTERIALTVTRLQERLVSQVQIRQRNENLLRSHQKTQAPVNRILVREQGDVHVIASADIVAIEAADDYVVIQTLERSYIKQERLSHLESILDTRLFCRIHRSSIINLDYLSGIETEGKETRFANLKNKKQYAISRSGYSKLIDIL